MFRHIRFLWPAALCAGLALAAGISAFALPAAASEDYPDQPGLHVMPGTPPEQVGECLVELRGWFAYAEKNRVPVDPVLLQMNTAYEHAANEGDEAYQQRVLVGAAAANRQTESDLATGGPSAAAQRFSNEVDACGLSVRMD